jgi:hypothetical protein
MSKPIKLIDELSYTSAPELAAAIRAKHVSCEAVVNAYLRHIETVNPRLNAAGSSPMIHALGRERQVSLNRGRNDGADRGSVTTQTPSIGCSELIFSRLWYSRLRAFQALRAPER